jgi:hypothetical protein
MLLGEVVPTLKKLREEGQTGYKKIQEYTRYLTVPICVIQSMGLEGPDGTGLAGPDGMKDTLQLSFPPKRKSGILWFLWTPACAAATNSIMHYSFCQML